MSFAFEALRISVDGVYLPRGRRELAEAGESLAKRRKSNAAELLVSLSAEKVLKKARKKPESEELELDSDEVRKGMDEVTFDTIFGSYDENIFCKSFKQWCKSVGFKAQFDWADPDDWTATLKPA